MRQAPHPEAPTSRELVKDATAIRIAHDGEGDGEERSEAIDPLKDLLRRIEEAEQEAENQRHPERVGEGLTRLVMTILKASQTGPARSERRFWSASVSGRRR